MQPKKQLKVQYIGIFEEINSLHWPKMHFLKEGQKIRAWVDPPPLFGQCPKENVFFHWGLPLAWVLIGFSYFHKTPIAFILDWEVVKVSDAWAH